jgi:single-strand DNA-binding protein
MPAVNNVQLIGNLGKEPETRFTPAGRKVCHFSLAVNRRGADEADWFLVEAWERLGEVCQQYLAKGRLVYIEGRLRTERYNDEKGETHHVTKVVARQMQMLDRKPGEQDMTEEGDLLAEA